MRDQKLGIIVLAAGGSKRLGSPKQLVSYEGTSLIKYASVTAIITEYPVVAVLGAFSAKIGQELADLPVEIVVNPGWRKGISTSISKGMGAIRKMHPELEAVIITLCDQPEVSPETIERLAEEYERTGMPIVASAYNGTLGVPALFGYEMFGELRSLSGDKGAKSLIDRYEDSLVTSIDAPEAALDVDTESDVESLKELAAVA